MAVGDLQQPGRGTVRQPKPAQAQKISGSVPEVDHAAIRVVTDNYQFALSPSGKIGDVMVERVGFPLSDKPPEKVLLSEFAYRYVSRPSSGVRRGMFSSISAIPRRHCLTISRLSRSTRISSTLWSRVHGHYDHFGGIVEFLAATKGKRKPENYSTILAARNASARVSSLSGQRRSISAHPIEPFRPRTHLRANYAARRAGFDDMNRPRYRCGNGGEPAVRLHE